MTDVTSKGTISKKALVNYILTQTQQIVLSEGKMSKMPLTRHKAGCEYRGANLADAPDCSHVRLRGRKLDLAPPFLHLARHRRLATRLSVRSHHGV
jgi:hypothetical protein